MLTRYGSKEGGGTKGNFHCFMCFSILFFVLTCFVGFCICVGSNTIHWPKNIKEKRHLIKGVIWFNCELPEAEVLVSYTGNMKDRRAGSKGLKSKGDWMSGVTDLWVTSAVSELGDYLKCIRSNHKYRCFTQLCRSECTFK